MSRYTKYYDALKADPEKYKSYLARKRRETTTRISTSDVEAKRKKSWRTRNAEKNQLLRRAHYALEQAVKHGKLQRPKHCSNCGSEGRVEGHHHRGYEPAHFLDVVWLCPPCHRKADNGQ